MRIDIWSDIVCPFCYIGKRHFEQALETFEHADDVDVVWHSFELDPTTPREATAPLAQKIADKYGMTLAQSEQSQRDIAARAAEVGLEFNWREAKYGNTFDAHRLVHLAAKHGLATKAEDVLMHAYFTAGVQIGDPEQLQRLGEEIGLPADEVRSVLAGDEFGEAVRDDEQQARDLGITGVPFFVLDNTYAVSGAQPTELFSQALAQTWAERGSTSTSSTSTTNAVTGDAPADAPHDHDGHDHSHGAQCEGDHCAV